MVSRSQVAIYRPEAKQWERLRVFINLSYVLRKTTNAKRENYNVCKRLLLPKAFSNYLSVESKWFENSVYSNIIVVKFKSILFLFHNVINLSEQTQSARSKTWIAASSLLLEPCSLSVQAIILVTRWKFTFDTS